MSEEPAEEEAQNIPWLAIAVAVAVVGIVVTVALSSVEPPPPPSEPKLVSHEPIDLGGWEPFADTGAPDVGGSDTSRPTDASEAD